MKFLEFLFPKITEEQKKKSEEIAKEDGLRIWPAYHSNKNTGRPSYYTIFTKDLDHIGNVYPKFLQETEITAKDEEAVRLERVKIIKALYS